MAAVTLGADELQRYARQIVLKEVGGAGQKRLRAASVTVVGAGGIGSPALQYLAAAGVGHLTVIDDDHVDASNLQRQTLFATADIGASKAEGAATRLAALNSHIAITTRATRLNAANIAILLEGSDVVLDGCDNFDTRLIVADHALAARIPLVSAAVGQFEGQLGVYRGWEADKPCYRCFVGGEPATDGASCAEDGVLGPVTGILGSLAALEVLRQIVGFGEDSAGTLLLADLLSLRFRTIRLAKDPGCRWCGSEG